MTEDIKLRNGLHAGIVIVIVGTFMHAIDPRIFLNSYGLIAYIVFLFYMIRSVRQIRKKEGGYITFASAFVAAFIPMTIGVFFYSLFNYAIHNWINPDIVLMIKEIALESAEFARETMSDYFNVEMEEEEMKSIVENLDVRLNLGTTFLSWLLTTLMGSVPALIIAAFMRRAEN